MTVSTYRFAARTLMALAALVLLGAAVLAATGLMTGARNADVAVVLGNKVEPDGQPSPRLAARLDTAYDCYAASRCRILFVSGGVDPAGTDEAAAMRDYL
ncbi:MAG TPA: YdcF family protein, partial [Achromobacter sp.]|nr:YdcF family protein [Achromobacter sp.]